MLRNLAVSLLISVLAGCAAAPPAATVANGIKPAPFSDHAAGAPPSGWAELILMRTKKLTRYQLVQVDGRTALHARADGSASGLIYRLEKQVTDESQVSWQWKVPALIDEADNAISHAEDSPVRILLSFDGDKDSLPFKDQITFETARTLTGREMPYATLMYIWENRLPVGTVIPNARTDRVKMIVAASGPEGLGEWRDFRRNIAADYEKAFGERPGRLIGVGVLTDTDNTGATVEAWYGDIRLTPAPL